MKTNLLTLLTRKTGNTIRKNTFFFMLFIVVFLQQGVAQTANIFVNPATISIGSGQSFTVNVRVDITSGAINAAEIHLDFNPAMLQVTNITRPGAALFTSETISLPAGPYNSSNIINTSGQINYAAGLPTGSTSTDFDILAITFTHAVPLIAGTTPLTLVNVPGRRTRAVLGATVATGSLTNGSVTIVSCTPPTATIASSSSSSICNGQPVGLRLASATGVSPYSLVINGTTYNNVTVGSTFATIPFPTYSIFPSNPTPAVPNNNEGQSIEVGVKFRSSQAGFIKGIRFYNGNNNSGTYTGKLWEYSTGKLIGSAVFSSVTTNGWQQVMFATPVSIAANTTYIASYYSTAGYYAVTDNYLNSAVTNGPLTALANNGVSGANGVYRYGAGMPNVAYSASNYWVDVIFTQNSNSFNLTSVTDNGGCNSSGALQTLNVTSVDCSTLPVTLLNFSASPNGKRVMLRWSTSSEINNKGFDVLRSVDGVNWLPIGYVAGMINSSSAKSYSYPDDNLQPGHYFYKLKQIDVDEKYKFSIIVSAVIGGKGEYMLAQNYPNPFSTQTTIQYTLPQSGHVNLSLYDISGRVVKILVDAPSEAGTHAISFNTGSLTKGIYYYRIQVDDFTDVKKMTIQ